MRVILAIFSLLFFVCQAPAYADGVAGTVPAGSSQGRLLPDVSTLTVAKNYGEYLASVGHPPREMSDLPQSPLAGCTADMEVRGSQLSPLEAECEQPSVAESLAADQRLPQGSYVRHESALDVLLGGGWRLVGNDGLANGREETFVGVGYSPADDMVVAVGYKIRGEEAPDEEHHGPRPFPFGITVMLRR